MQLFRGRRSHQRAALLILACLIVVTTLAMATQASARTTRTVHKTATTVRSRPHGAQSLVLALQPARHQQLQVSSSSTPVCTDPSAICIPDGIGSGYFTGGGPGCRFDAVI